MKGKDYLKRLYEMQPSPLPKHARPTLSGRYRSMKPEKRIKKQIVDMIKWSGKGTAWVVENTGQFIPGKVEVNVIGKGVQVGKPHMRYSPNKKGHSDIQALVRGRSLFIELKRRYAKGKDRMSDAQKAFKREVESAGALYWVVEDLDDFYNQFIEYIMEEG